jgi:hypothetical protein
MTWTNPAASGSPVTSTVTSLLSLKLASPMSSLEVSAHRTQGSEPTSTGKELQVAQAAPTALVL